MFELFRDLCAQAIFHMPGIFVEYLSQSCLYDDQLSFVPPPKLSRESMSSLLSFCLFPWLTIL